MRRGLRDRGARAGRAGQRLRRRERRAQQHVAGGIGRVDAEQDADLAGGACGARRQADEDASAAPSELKRIAMGVLLNGRATRQTPLKAYNRRGSGLTPRRTPEVVHAVLPARDTSRAAQQSARRAARARRRRSTIDFSRSSRARRSSRRRAAPAARRSSACRPSRSSTCSTDCTGLPLIASSTSPASMPARAAAPSTSSTTRPASTFASRFSRA